MHTLVVAALPEEADAVLPGRGQAWPDTPFATRVIADAGIAVLVCGLGKANAAAATAHGAAVHAPARVLMTGVCGRVAPLDGTAFWLAEAVQHDYGATRGGRFERYTAGALPIGPAALAPFRAMTDPGVGLPHARIASGDAFVEDAAAAAALADALDAPLVDMEVAAVAQVAEHLGLPWAAVKAPTDDADHGGAHDFARNLAAAAARAAAGVERLLALLADG